MYVFLSISSTPKFDYHELLRCNGIKSVYDYIYATYVLMIFLTSLILSSFDKFYVTVIVESTTRLISLWT